MKKILFIRFSSIGDIVLTTPLIRCAKLQLLQAEIHYLTKTQFRPLLQANPYISKIFFLEDAETIKKLKEEKYDYIIDLHKNLRSFGIRFKLRRPAYSFSKLNIRKYLLVNFKINVMPVLHVVDRYFLAVRKLGVENDGKGLDYFIPQNGHISMDSLPVAYRDGFLAVITGAKHATKIFPAEKLAELLRNLEQPVILFGGAEDFTRAEMVRKLAGREILNICGKYNLNQSAALLSLANMVVSNDTGFMHIAAALKKNIISLWGNTVPEFGMYPYLPEGTELLSEIIQVQTLSCRPCSKIGYARCPKKHFNCMQKIDVSKIVKLLKP